MIPEGLQWNQAELELGDPLNLGLLSLLVIDDSMVPRPIGTAFLVTANGHFATAVTAAHCFEGIRQILHPNAKHHPSALSEFLPPPKELDLKQVKAVYIKDGAAYLCPIEIGIWDNATDLAVFTVSAPSNEPKIFRDFFWLDDQLPNAGEVVAMIGFGEMTVTNDPEIPDRGTMQRQLLLRVGRVEEVFPERHYMLKGPCVQTSIGIFSGMSGGVVAKWAPGSTIKPFAFISHAPDPQPSYDRSLSGSSMGSILKAKITALGEKKQALEFMVSNVGVGKDGSKSELVSSFEFFPFDNGTREQYAEHHSAVF